MKIDSNGDKLWAKTYGGAAAEHPSVLIPSSGNTFYITGYTESNNYDCSGNHGSVPGYYDDFYVAKIDGDDNLIWHKDIGGSGIDQAYSSVADGAGGVLLVGTTQSVDGDVSHPTDYKSGIWLVDVAADGSIVWDKCYGGKDAECKALCKGTNGDIWMMCTAGSDDLDLYASGGQGNTDAWVIHTDNVGNIINTKVLGSENYDRGLMIHALINGDVLAAGIYRDASGSFRGLTCDTVANIFLAKFSPENQTSVPVSSMAASGINIFPNPSTDHITIEATKKGKLDISVTSILGSQVIHLSTDTKAELLVSDWPRGLYILSVTDEAGQRFTGKIALD